MLLAIAGACRGPAPSVVREPAPPPEVLVDPLGEALRRAVRGNQVACARELLAAGVGPDAPDSEGETALHLVRSEAMTALLLAHGANARAIDAEGKPVSRVDAWLPLALARRLVRTLVAAGASLETATAVQFLDADDVRPTLAQHAPSDPCLLHFAAERGDVPIVELLLAAGAAREGDCPSRYMNVDSWGENALATAVQHGHYAAAASLLAAGLPVRGDGWPDSRHGEPEGGLLQRAAGEAPIGFVAQLLDAGAAVEGTGAGDTPLAHAGGRGRADVVQLLLARGADPHRTSGGASPLRHASIGGHADVADRLVAAGATMTLLDAVALDRPNDVRRLLEREPEARERPDERLGMRPLLWAVALGRTNVVETLLAAGAEVNARSGERTAIDIADAWWPRDGLRFLASDGISAFGRAVARSDWRLASTLVAAGARPTAEEARGLASCDGEAVFAVLRQLAAQRALGDDAMLGALHGVMSSRLPFALRDERFRLLLDSGAAALLPRDEARRVLRYADPASVAPFAGALRAHGWRPDLPTACRFGWLDDVHSLLRAGELGQHRGGECWMAALAGDQPLILRALRAHVDEPFWSVRRIAEQAAYHGATRVLLDLLGRGDVTLAECGAGDLDLLRRAAGASGDQAEFVQTLLDLGSDPNALHRGLPPLVCACWNPSREVIARLLAAGARPDLGYDDRCALSELLRQGIKPDTVPCIRMLLAAGADPVEGDFLVYLEPLLDYGPTPELRQQLSELWTECRKHQP